MAAPHDSAPAPFDPAAICVVLLDIEGTTTPADFVYNVLFPYARARLGEFLAVHADDTGVRDDIALLRSEYEKDARLLAPASPGQSSAESTPTIGANSGSPPDRAAQNTAVAVPPRWDDSPGARVPSAAAYALWLMDQDRKSTALKSLQGKIWEAGYENGELRGEVYPEVPPALARWKQQGRRIAIFSSGSVQAQQLLFRHSTAGDLTPYIAAYFDTTTGPKHGPASYRAIANALASSPQSVLFISDVVAELEAARSAGMHTALAVRSGAPLPTPTPRHPAIQTFDDLRM